MKNNINENAGIIALVITILIAFWSLFYIVSLFQGVKWWHFPLTISNLGLMALIWVLIKEAIIKFSK